MDWQLASGYRFAGVHSGLRASEPGRLDLALVVSDRPARVAGAFTQNRVRAAPVRVCQERLPARDVRGVVICSGNANACTGEQGLRDAYRMAEVAAGLAACKAEQMLVCSTGVIGRLLPMQIIEPGIAAAARELADGPRAFDNAARAILTTDTRIKVATRRVPCGDQTITLTGFAKGAAMIGPNLATMLAFVLTDAAVEPAHLGKLAPEACARSFNSVSVEGHTSTNDTVLIFCNGTGAALAGQALAAFDEAVTGVCQDLAREIAADAEGANHLVTIEVDGLRSEEEARKVAKTVADSALVKTAIFGADPNWGRFVSAAGYSGVEFAEKDLSLWQGEMQLYKDGVPLPFDEKAASAYLKDNREITLRFRFNLGQARCTFWTCDLTYEYVKLNADYTT
ncbi:MAG: bifunctional glutamate N-acetyltransferase/amino-acid acetyltransferase ArgJ [Gemmataceae bacterium]